MVGGLGRRQSILHEVSNSGDLRLQRGIKPSLRHEQFVIPSGTPTSAFGKITASSVHLTGAAGPSVLIAGGCHGDEFEGQAICCALQRALVECELAGSVTLVPALNPPAAAAATRTSSVDGGNLNTVFPGGAGRGPTHQIARWLSQSLLPGKALFIDLHSGGKGVEYAPSIMLLLQNDLQADDRLARLASVSDLQIAFRVDRRDDKDDSIAAEARRLGVPALSFEMGGSLSLRPGQVQQGVDAILNVLAEMGMIAARAPRGTPEFVRRLPVAESVCAPICGIFEPLVEPGDPIQAGQLIARVHSTLTPWTPPQSVQSEVEGIVISRRSVALVERGDGLFKLGVTL
jgi:uncharacterized protein